MPSAAAAPKNEGEVEGEVEGQDETLEERMDLANRRYNSRDYEGAIEQALSILAQHPDNVRMLRVIVSSSCLTGDEDMARKYYPKLPEKAQRIMRVRCGRNDIGL